MIVTCSKCQTRLQLDEARIPAHSFSVRCPKCGHANNVQPLTGNSVTPLNEARAAVEAATEDASSLAASARLEHATPALSAAAPDKTSVAKSESAISAEDVVRLLSALLQRGAASEASIGGSVEDNLFGHSWVQSRALV